MAKKDVEQPAPGNENAAVVQPVIVEQESEGVIIAREIDIARKALTEKEKQYAEGAAIVAQFQAQRDSANQHFQSLIRRQDAYNKSNKSASGR